MKLKIWHWITLAIVAYVFFLIKLMPAAWLLNSRIVPVPNNIIVSGVSGTIWNGQANRILAQGVAVDQVSWDLSFLALLMGQVSADVMGGRLRDQDAVYLKGSVTAYLLNQHAFDLTNTTILVPAQSVMGQMQLPVPVTAKGRFKADIATLEFDSICQVLSGSGAWNNGMVSGLQGPIEFGSFNALLNCVDGDLQIKVLPDNKLQLDALLIIKNAGGYSIDGVFKIPPDMPEEVEQAAVFFGRPDAQGFRRINL